MKVSVINPSEYPRSDYVELDITGSDMASRLDAAEDALVRLDDGREGNEVPYQIDRPFGENDPTRLLTFFASDIPPGREDYTQGGPTVNYQFVSRNSSTSERDQGKLWCAYYYSNPKPIEPSDGYSLKWDRKRSAAIDGVKLANERLEVYFRTRPSFGRADLPYVGAATSVEIPEIKEYVGNGDFLAAYLLQPCDDELWGQLVKLTFLPPPWQRSAPTTILLRNQQYEVVWSNTGPVRAVVSLRSAPFTLEYEPSLPDGKRTSPQPFKCHLYRILSVYPNCRFPFYEEQLFVRLSKTGCPLWFRPSFLSRLPPPGVSTDVRWFEHIPDYFAVWRHFGPSQCGFLFGADAHIRSLHFHSDTTELSWNLQTTNRIKAIHGFIFHNRLPHDFDPSHVAGRYIWYEHLFKPLRAWSDAVPLSPVPLSYD